jgi:hypothetical protein
MSMQNIRDCYGVPAKRGAPVMTEAGAGVITGSRGQYLRIRLYGDRRSKIYHPTWRIEYVGSADDPSALDAVLYPAVDVLGEGGQS